MQSFHGTSQVCNTGQWCNLTHSAPNEAASDKIMDYLVCNLTGNQGVKGTVLLLTLWLFMFVLLGECQ